MFTYKIILLPPHTVYAKRLAKMFKMLNRKIYIDEPKIINGNTQ